MRTHYDIGLQKTKTTSNDGSSKSSHNDNNNHDVVTVISNGQILVPSLFYGVIAAGGVYSAASPSSTVDELARQIQMGKSRLVVCGSEHIDVALQAAAKVNVSARNVLVLDSTEGQWSLRSLGSDNSSSSIDALSPPHQRLPWKPITDPAILKSTLAVILWSSGTTGLPKGVMLSQANLVAETYITSILPREYALAQLDAFTKQNPGVSPPPAPAYRTLAHLPISHIAGLWGYLVGPMYSGGTVYWMSKYSWPDLLRYARQYQITIFYTVPSIFLRIAKSPDVTDHFSHLVGAVTGAAPMDGTLQKAADARLGAATSTSTTKKEQLLGQTWGLSETTGAVTAQPKGEPDDTGSIGAVLPGVELRIVDEAYRDVQTPGSEGELLVRSPLVMMGYFDNPEATRTAFHGDDWFCTGDIGVLRNGKFYVVDRKKVCLLLSERTLFIFLFHYKNTPFARMCVLTLPPPPFSLTKRNFSNTKAYKSPPPSSKGFFSSTPRSARPLSLACPTLLPATCPGLMSCQKTITGTTSQPRRSRTTSASVLQATSSFAVVWYLSAKSQRTL